MCVHPKYQMTIKKMYREALKISYCDKDMNYIIIRKIISFIKCPTFAKWMW